MSGDKMKEYILIMVLAIVVIIALLGLASLYTENPGLSTNQKTTETNITYSYFTIDGMPCVYVREGFGRSITGGPSCDWSKK